MPKKFMKRYMPTPEKIRSIRALHFLGDILHEPNLWHINRHGIARAFLIGIFMCFIPMPFQMVIAALCAIWLNANLPLSVALVWISNPLTMPPMFYFNYKVGAWLLNHPVKDYQFELSIGWIKESLVDIGIPLYFGSLIVATISSCTCYLIIQYLWRRRVRASWEERRVRRLQQEKS